LINLAHGGSDYRTCHRWATRAQVLAAPPQSPEFLAAKREYDPANLFRSGWYTHHSALLGVSLAAG